MRNFFFRIIFLVLSKEEIHLIITYTISTGADCFHGDMNLSDATSSFKLILSQ